MLGRRSLARRERARLCATALEVGPDAPTLCDGWDVRLLLAHILVRERNPIAAAGTQVAPLEPLAEKAMAGWAERDFAEVVETVRRARTPLALPVVDDVMNTLEFFVHHEDVRRAQPAWEQRALTHGEESALWTAIRFVGRGLVRPAGVPVTIRRTDGDGTAVLRGGDGPAVLAGLPSEIVLFLYGRRDHTRGLELTGPEESLARLRGADLGL